MERKKKKEESELEQTKKDLKDKENQALEKELFKKEGLED